MNIHIATAGEKEPVEAAFKHENQLGSIDKLYIVTGEGFNYKFDKLQTTIETKIIEVNSFSFEAVVNCLVGIYTMEKSKTGKKDRIFMNITGGTNILAVAAYVLSMFLGIDCYYILKEGPIIFKHSDTHKRLSKNDKECLKLFDNRENVSSNRENSKQLKILEKKGLVQFYSCVITKNTRVKNDNLDYFDNYPTKDVLTRKIRHKYAKLTPEGKFYFNILKESNWKI